MELESKGVKASETIETERLLLRRPKQSVFVQSLDAG